MNDTVPTINRVAVVVEPKEPYLAWARALNGHDPAVDSMSRENLTSVYLIEESDNSEEPPQRHWGWIFEENLQSWHRDPSAWPRDRTYSLFEEWFDVRIVDIVYDLAEGSVKHEE